MPPVMSLLKDVSTAPDAALTAARPDLTTPLMRVNRPPTYSVELVVARDSTALLVLLVKPKVVSGAPVVRLRLATFCLATPLTVLKVPPTKSLVPSGLGSTAATPPLKVGRNCVSKRAGGRVYLARFAWL